MIEEAVSIELNSCFKWSGAMLLQYLYCRQIHSLVITLSGSSYTPLNGYTYHASLNEARSSLVLSILDRKMANLIFVMESHAGHEMKLYLVKESTTSKR